MKRRLKHGPLRQHVNQLSLPSHFQLAALLLNSWLYNYGVIWQNHQSHELKTTAKLWYQLYYLKKLVAVSWMKQISLWRKTPHAQGSSIGTVSSCVFFQKVIRLVSRYFNEENSLKGLKKSVNLVTNVLTTLPVKDPWWCNRNCANSFLESNDQRGSSNSWPMG